MEVRNKSDFFEAVINKLLIENVKDLSDQEVNRILDPVGSPKKCKAIAFEIREIIGRSPNEISLIRRVRDFLFSNRTDQTSKRLNWNECLEQIKLIK